MNKNSLNIIQISDLHLLTDTTAVVADVNTYTSLEGVIQHIIHTELKIDLILATGDLIHDDKISSYTHVAEQLKRLAKPIYWIAGNHDLPNLYQVSDLAEPPFSADKHILTPHWSIILLDSTAPGETPGTLRQSELDRLEQLLNQFPKHHTLIALHHPPGDELNDLTNSQALWSIVDKHPQVKVCLFGHFHHAYAGMRGSIHLYGCPSTCYQFIPWVLPVEIHFIPPGYRYLKLGANGKCSTTIYRSSL